MNRGILLALLEITRAPAVVTVWSNLIAAQIIGMGGQLLPYMLAHLLIGGSLLYWFGMCLNDVMDYDEDRRHRPNRPLPAGRIGRTGALIFAIACALAGVFFIGRLGALQLTLALALLVAITLYNTITKHTVFGPVMMASCRYLLWLLGLSVAGLQLEHFLIAAPVFFYIMALTVLSRAEDAPDDTRVVHAVMALIVLSTVAALATLAIGALRFPPTAIVILTASLWLLWQLWQLKARFVTEQIRQMVGKMIFLVIPVDALLLLSDTEIEWAIVVLLLIFPGRWLRRAIAIT